MHHPTISSLQYLAIFSFFLLSAALSHAQSFYKWVDANGSTHYTQTPPPKNAKQLGTIYTYQDKSPSSSDTSHQKAIEQNQPQTIGNSFVIATEGGIMEIPPLEDGQSIKYNK